MACAPSDTTSRRRPDLRRLDRPVSSDLARLGVRAPQRLAGAQRQGRAHPHQLLWHQKSDLIYVLDTTNPGAQEYLRQTYRTLVREWGVRFIKLDFMDSSAIEGFMYRPNTTALEALRIGLQIIRDAVGEDVILDKDGSPMLTPGRLGRHRTHFRRHRTFV